MRVVPSISAAEYARLLSALEGAQATVAGVWTAVLDGINPARIATSKPTVQFTVPAFAFYRDGDGMLNRGFEVRCAAVLTDYDGGLANQNYLASMARLIYGGGVLDSITPQNVDALDGGTLKLSNPRLGLGMTEGSSALLMDLTILITLRTADLLEDRTI